jgi:hypothetical protein
MGLTPEIAWAISMWALAIGGTMFAFAPKGDPWLTVRSMAFGVWVWLYAMFVWWWHFS